MDEVGLGGVVAVQVVWGEYCDSLLCSFLLGFWRGDGACMVVDIEGGSGGDKIVVERCLVHF